MTCSGSLTFAGFMALDGSSGALTLSSGSPSVTGSVQANSNIRTIQLNAGTFLGTALTGSNQLYVGIASGCAWAGAITQSTPSGIITLSGAGMMSGQINMLSSSGVGLMVSCIFTGSVLGFTGSPVAIQVLGGYFAGSVLAGSSVMEFQVANGVTIPSGATITQTGTAGRVTLTGSGIHGQTIYTAGTAGLTINARCFSTINAYASVTIQFQSLGTNFTGMINTTTSVVTVNTAIGVALGSLGAIVQGAPSGQIILTGPGSVAATLVLQYATPTNALNVNGPTVSGTIRAGLPGRNVGLVLTSGAITGLVLAQSGGVFTIDLAAGQTCQAQLVPAVSGTTYRLINSGGTGTFAGPITLSLASSSLVLEAGTVSGVVTFTGAAAQFTMSGGAINSISVNSGDLLITNSVLFGATISLGGAAAVAFASGSVGSSSAISLSAAAQLTVNGGAHSGAITLFGNALPYAVTVVGGSLTGSITVQTPTARISLSGSGLISAPTTFSGVNNALNVTANGGGALWSGSFEQTTTGQSITFSGSGTVTGAISLRENGVFVLDRTFTGIMTSPITLASATSNVQTVFNAPLLPSGDGRYQGAITINSGSLTVAGSVGISGTFFAKRHSFWFWRCSDCCSVS